jgi:hypothetical protein
VLGYSAVNRIISRANLNEDNCGKKNLFDEVSERFLAIQEKEE